MLGTSVGLGDDGRRRTRCSWAPSTAGTSGPSVRSWNRRTADAPCSTRRAERISTILSAQVVATATGAAELARQCAVQRRQRLATKAAKAGWSRIESGHRARGVPRIDPAVICLVHDGADRVVLARQDGVAAAVLLLAGFVEGRRVLPETCVVRVKSPRRSAFRARRRIPRQPTVAVPPVTDGGLPRWPTRAGVLLQRRRDRRRRAGSPVSGCAPPWPPGTGRRRFTSDSACFCPARFDRREIVESWAWPEG